MTSLTLEACKPTGAKPRDAERSKNFFALGLVVLAVPPPDRRHRATGSPSATAKNPIVVEANTLAFRAGYNFGETAELFESVLRDRRRPSSRRARTRTSPATPPSPGGWSPPRSSPSLPLFLGSYPITPASDILHELSKHKNFGVRTLQAEDEIAGVGAALGAAFGGALGVTTTSGPGRRPQVRDGRARGQPRAAARSSSTSSAAAPRPDCRPRPSSRTCSTRCSAATARRRSRSSRRRRPSHCFEAAIEAVRIALTLPDAGLPALRRLPRQRLGAVAAPRRRLPARHRRPSSPSSRTTTDAEGEPVFWPYLRDPETLARPWARARHARPRAPHRRPREGRTAPATSPTTRPTTRQMVQAARRQDRRHREGHPARRGRRPGRRREGARARLGLDLRRDHRRRAAGRERGASASLRRTSSI